jgi:hypothetical protein
MDGKPARRTAIKGHPDIRVDECDMRYGPICSPNRHA